MLTAPAGIIPSSYRIGTNAILKLMPLYVQAGSDILYLPSR